MKLLVLSGPNHVTTPRPSLVREILTTVNIINTATIYLDTKRLKAWETAWIALSFKTLTVGLPL
jgi:hypothetical protein